jgi:ABC-type transport system substrate-binding protein
MAAAIKDQLLKAGIGVTIETKSWDDYLQALRNRTFDLALCGFNLDRSLDLAGLLHSGGSINYSGYSDGSVNGQLEAYAKSTEEADRKKNMHGVQKAVVRDLPVISICFRTYSLVSQAKVQSVEGIYDMDFYYGIERWFIKD